MTDFTITEDFPKSEIEFDQRFSNSNACYDYLFKKKWPNGFVCKKCGHSKYWVSARNLYICTECEHNHIPIVIVLLMGLLYKLVDITSLIMSALFIG